MHLPVAIRTERNSIPQRILAAGQIYAINETGTVFIYKANPKKFESGAEIPMGTEGFATPVACGDRVYLRVTEGTGGNRIEKLYYIGRRM